MSWNIPMPFWKSGSTPPPPVDGLRILLDMSNYQDVLDAPAGIDWEDQDLTDGQANNAPMFGGNMATGISVGMGTASGGWDDVAPGSGGTNNGYVALTPVGPRDYTLEINFSVDGASGDDVQLWLFQHTHNSAFQMGARVRYYTADGRFNLYAGFDADSFNIDIDPTVTHNLVVNVREYVGAMEADFILDGVSVGVLVAGTGLNAITDVRITFPVLLAPTPTGAGLTFQYGGFSLVTTS